MRLIDADRLDYTVPEGPHYLTSILVQVLKKTIDKCPTVDAVPVVRCKDCKHLVAVNVNGKGIPTCRMSGMEVAPAEFCSRGEKGCA